MSNEMKGFLDGLDTAMPHINASLNGIQVSVHIRFWNGDASVNITPGQARILALKLNEIADLADQTNRDNMMAAVRAAGA